MFPEEVKREFKKAGCFDKLLDEIMRSVNASGNPLSVKVEILSKQLIYDAITILNSTFYWDRSICGKTYWFDMYHKLLKIKENES